MIKKNKFPGVDFEKPLKIRVTCYGCGRVTEISSTNAIVLMLQCQVCGATGFKREPIN